MPHLRIREIMDDLNTLGGMTSAHHALITELVAVCLSAARPTPVPSSERVRAFREREAMKRETFHVTSDAVDNNINSSIKTEDTTPLKRGNVSRGTRLPETWNPSESLWTWGKTKLPEDALRFETAAFKDYWAAQPGSKGVKLDWDKTWKTWVREAVRRRERFKPKSNVVEYKPRSGPKWTDVEADYKAKYGADAFKRYSEDQKQ